MRSMKNLAIAMKRRIWGKDPDNKVPKIFYCHVPKCAGSSVAGEIRQHMFADYRVETFSINLEASQKSSQIFSMDMMTIREIVLSYNLSIPQNYFGSGHVYCRPDLVASHMNEWDFITILRNPIDRWISEYVYNTYKDIVWMKNSLPLEEYLVSERGKLTGISFIRYFSSMPNSYAGNFDEFVDEAIENLGRFSVIGTLENLESWCNSFKTRYNKDVSIPLRNTSPNSEAMDKIRSNDSIRRKIEMLCEPDIRVYQRIAEQTGIPELRLSRRQLKC